MNIPLSEPKIKDILLDNDNVWKVLDKGIETGLARPFLSDVVKKMLGCGKEEGGFATYKCEGCGEEKKVCFSCKTRFCNKCGVRLTDQWVERTEARMIDVEHRHSIFTTPSELWVIFAIDRDLLKILQPKAYEVLSEWGESLGIIQGVTTVLHTFGSKDLKWYPHVHSTVSEGGLTKSGKWKGWYWNKKYKQPYIDFKFLQQRWRSKILLSLRQKIPSIWAESSIVREHIHNTVNEIRKRENKCIRKNLYRAEIKELIEHLFKKEWVVNAESRLSSGVHTIRYIGRYSKRPVIAESRIVSYDGEYVDFLCEYEEEIIDETGTGSSVVRLPVEEFIIRLLRHIPDKGFRMINHFGLYAAPKWNKVKWKLKLAMKYIEKKIRALKWNEWMERCFGKDPLECSICGGRMLLYTIHYLKNRCMRVKRHLLPGGYIARKANRAWISGINKFTEVREAGQLSFA